MNRLARRRLLAWLAATTAPGLGHAADNTSAGSDDARGVSRRPLRFPRDFGAHLDTRTEWWYLTGWLVDAQAGAQAGEQVGAQAKAPADDAASGRAIDPSALIGFQITFFRSRTDVPASSPSRFAATQLVFAHAAISAVATRRQRHDQRVARAGFGLAEADERDASVTLRDWQLERADAGTGTGTSTAGSRYRIEARSDQAGFGFELSAQTTQPLLLQGDAGYSRKGPLESQASHYYSQPQLQVSGSLSLDGRAREVRGRGWLDHEWSEALMPPDAIGWDWLGINLFDGSALTAFRLRRSDGSAVWHGGSLRRAGGPTRHFGPDDLRFEPGRRWRSPATQAEYPVTWQLHTPEGRFALEALFDAQELDSRSSTGAVYWEGLSALRDASGALIGCGYLEMTGYASRLRLG